ncbi:DUF2878 domain-containing protein [Vibrio makurazakiensis]|uniref:DUF2878 domain-containing protein n=1 Tax=Vibrio makurazakiensis TaxID=2910250 RepID=UPI003D1284A3
MKRFWIINLVLFQVCWFCAAFLTQHAAPLMFTLMAIHFYLSPTRKEDAYLLLLVPIGFAADKLQLELGVFSVGSGFFPFWLLMMWSMFLISLNHSLSWLNNRSVITLMVIGAIGGTSSYWGGVKAGVIEPLLATEYVTLSLMTVWAIILPIFVCLKKQLELYQSKYEVTHV